MIFDNWNVEGSSCGIVNGQTVFAGCGYTYIVEEECLKQCAAYGGTCVETKFNIDGWVDPASATKDGERARLLPFFCDVFSLLTYYSPISTQHTLSENCGSVSFSACSKFVQTFNRLYEARNKEMFPDENPMLQDSDYGGTSVRSLCLSLCYCEVCVPLIISLILSIYCKL